VVSGDDGLNLQMSSRQTFLWILAAK